MNEEVQTLATFFSVEIDPNEDRSIIALKVFEAAMSNISDERERHRMALVNAEWIKASHQEKLNKINTVEL